MTTTTAVRREPRVGDCPVCWSEQDLNMAGRVRPHGTGRHRCDGAGMFPRGHALERRIWTEEPARIEYWRRPTCQVCCTPLFDRYGNPSWDVTANVTFVCRGGCHRNEGLR